MSYGCKIINSAGSTMIDENYTNLALRQKITVLLEIGDYTDPYHVYAPLTIDFAPCMVAYRCDAFIGQYTCYQPSGSSGRYFTFVGETNAGNNTNGIPVTFYIFGPPRSEEHTSELQSLMRNSYAVFCLKKKKKIIRKYSIKKYKTTTNEKIIKENTYVLLKYRFTTKIHI